MAQTTSPISEDEEFEFRHRYEMEQQAQQPPMQAAPDYGLRPDGTKKGSGFYGPLPSKDPRYPKGTVSTELSADTDVNGKNLSFPLLVPGLSRKEIDSLLSGERPSDAIYDKAIGHAQQRIANGQSPFAGPEDEQIPVPNHPMPTMSQVAQNAAGRGVADAWQNAYEAAANTFLGQVLTHGLKAFTGNQAITERPDTQKMAEQAGMVNPEHDAQNGPQRVVSAAIRGATAAASVPGPGLAGTVKAGVMGAASGAAGQTVREATREMLGETASLWLGVATGAIVPLVPLAKPVYKAMTAPPQSPLNTKTRMATLEAAQKEGFVVEPESVIPSASNKLRSSVAGGGKLKIAAAMENQKAMTESAKKELGLPLDAELTPPIFKALKTEAGKPYRELEQISGQQNLLEQVQQKRSEASALWTTYANMEKPSPEVRNLAKAADLAAKQLDDQIDSLADKSGVPGLLNRVRGARIAFGKIYDVETATNPGDGHVSLPQLGMMYREGKQLSGRLEVAAKFWNAFKPVAREGASLGTTASGTDAASAATLGTIASAGSGGIAGTLAGMIPFAREAARNKSLSPQVQRSLLDIDPTKLRLDLYPKAARGLTRSALIGSTLANTNKGESE